MNAPRHEAMPTRTERRESPRGNAIAYALRGAGWGALEGGMHGSVLGAAYGLLWPLLLVTAAILWAALQGELLELRWADSEALGATVGTGVLAISLGCIAGAAVGAIQGLGQGLAVALLLRYSPPTRVRRTLLLARATCAALGLVVPATLAAAFRDAPEPLAVLQFFVLPGLVSGAAGWRIGGRLTKRLSRELASSET